MSHRPLVTRTIDGQKVAYLEPRGEYVPRGVDVRRIVVLTQAAYDAIAIPDANTLYLIAEE